MRKWNPLHNHTIYSVKDGLAKVNDYVLKMNKFNYENKDYQYEALAITEHGFFSTYLKQKIACEESIDFGDGIKRSIKPIYGVEIYHSQYDTTKDVKYKKFKKNKVTGERDVIAEKETYHLVLLCKNNEGFSNLIKICSHAGLNSYSSGKKPIYRTDIPFMSNYGEGIIALSGCMSGLIPKLITNGKYDEAKQLALYFNNIFEHFYLETQCLVIPDVIIINEALVRMSKETGIELVITCDSHYIDEEDRDAHDILRSMAYEDEEEKDKETGKRKTMAMEDSLHLRTPIEVEKYCIDYGIPLSAMDNTVKIANMCDVDFAPKDKKGFMPDFKTPKGYNESTYLEEMSYKNLYKKMMQKHIADNISERFNRLRYELDVICNAGFAGYFLIVQDFVKKCTDRNIIIGPGRGSAAGALLSYCLGITNIDPIPYNFLFERFLNPSRTSFPDVDLDIMSSRRSEGIQILLDTYGEDNVCQIITYGKYSLKVVIKSIISYYYNESENYKEINNEINNFTKNSIGNNKINEKEITYDVLYEIYNNTDKYLEDNPEAEENDIKLGKKLYEEIQVLIEKYPEIEIGLSKLRGAINTVGLHAGGVIISSKPIKDYFPLAKSNGESAILPIIQLEMTDIDFFNLLKLDVLGLNTLSQLGETLDLANIDYSWINKEEFDDPNVYEFLRNGNTVNVFQMAKPQATRMLKDFKVSSLHDIMAVSAGVRPGLSNPTDVYDGKSPIDVYLEILEGKRQREYISPEIDKVLDETKGIIWYQEDCQLIGQYMAGYSLGGADSRIRKIIAKKKIKLIPEVRNEFIYGKASLYDEHHEVIGVSEENSIWCKGAVNNGYSEEIAKKTFELIEAMAKYAFNKSHAGSYSVLTYKSAYLSLYYPVEFTLGCLRHLKDDAEKQITINYCKFRGIKFLPLSINKSKSHFSMEIVNGEKCIRYGLTKVYGLKEAATNFIDFLSNKMEFTDFDDFIEASKDQELIKEYSELANVPIKKSILNKTHISNLILAGAFDEIEENRFALYNYYMSEYHKETDTEYDENSYSNVNKYALELAYLDDYVSGNPLDFIKLDEIVNLKNEQVVTFPCIVSNLQKGKYKAYDWKTRKKEDKEYYKIEMLTNNGSYYKGVIFEPLFSKVNGKIHATRLPKKLKGKTPKEKYEEALNGNPKRKKCIAIVTGMYNSEFNNFNISDIKTSEEIFKKVN